MVPTYGAGRVHKVTEVVPVQVSLKINMGSLNGKNKLVYFLRRRLSICPNLKELGYQPCGILSVTQRLSPRPRSVAIAALARRRLRL